jgi:hypothetical protein
MTKYWAVDQLVPRSIYSWPTEAETAAGELQFTTDHFSLADTPAGVVYTTHVVEQEQTDERTCRSCR